MFIQVKSQGKVVSVLCRATIVSVDLAGKQTSIRLLGKEEPIIYNQTKKDFKHLVKQLTSEL